MEALLSRYPLTLTQNRCIVAGQAKAEPATSGEASGGTQRLLASPVLDFLGECGGDDMMNEKSWEMDGGRNRCLVMLCFLSVLHLFLARVVSARSQQSRQRLRSRRRRRRQWRHSV